MPFNQDSTEQSFYAGDRRSPMGSRRATELANRVHNEKWVRHALDEASIKAKVEFGKVIVKNETDELRVRAAIYANPALNFIPIVIKP